MSGKRLIILAANFLIWLIYLVFFARRSPEHSYGYVVTVAFTAGCLMGLINVKRLALAANAVAWAFIIFNLVGSWHNALRPVVVTSAIAFTVGSFLTWVSSYSQ